MPNEKAINSFYEKVDRLSVSIVENYPGLILSEKGLDGLVELITAIPTGLRSGLTLFDDQFDNVDSFPKTAGKTFDVSYSLSQAIQVPDSTPVDPKGFTLMSSFLVATT